jgi:hypothetical protein
MLEISIGSFAAAQDFGSDPRSTGAPSMLLIRGGLPGAVLKIAVRFKISPCGGCGRM